MKLGENDEIIVRGPNIFPGYWNRPEETAKVLREAGFIPAIRAKSMQQGTGGSSGRIKNLIILNPATTSRPSRSKTKC